MNTSLNLYLIIPLIILSHHHVMQATFTVLPCPSTVATPTATQITHSSSPPDRNVDTVTVAVVVAVQVVLPLRRRLGMVVMVEVEE